MQILISGTGRQSNIKARIITLFISAIIGAILNLRKWDFHLVSMKTNDKPTDKHQDKKKCRT